MSKRTDAPLTLGASWRRAVITYPDRTAVSHRGATLTYRQLATMVDDLATQLVAAGARPETVVAVELPRSIQWVANVLAVAQSGAAFASLDLDEPAPRRRSMLEVCGALLLVSGDGITTLPSREVDLLTPETVSTDDGTHLAYVVFTSGSTGIPKAVLLEHRGVANYVAQAMQAYGLGPQDRQLQYSSLAFDIAIEELFTTLSSGAELVIRDDHLLPRARDLFPFCAANQVSVLNLPTGAWRQVAQDLGPDGSRVPECIRLVVIGGEAADSESLSAWVGSGTHPEFKVVNTYGPSEASIAVTMCELAPGEPISLGEPIGGVALRVIGSDGVSVTDGTIGELVLGGDAVARGYAGNPPGEAKRFTFDPRTGQRWYRTGDLVVRNPDGVISFHGRRDDQVKVRGFRVEPAEARSALMRLSGVADAEVIAVDTEAGKRLGAAVVAVSPSARDRAQLQVQLRKSIPAYMVPEYFVFLPALPLTVRGKVDRESISQQLAAATRRATSTEPSAQPTLLTLDSITRAVEASWAVVMGMAPEGPDEGFFEVGGDSLATVQLLTEIHNRTGVHVDMNAFYRSPTPAGLVALVNVDDDIPTAHYTTGRMIVKLRRAGVGRLWIFMPPLSGAVTRYASMARLLPKSDAVWACETPAHLSAQGLDSLASGLADALEKEEGWSSFQQVCLAGYSLGGVFALEVARHLASRASTSSYSTLDVLMLDPPPAQVALATFEETADVFVRVGWGIETPYEQFLVGGHLDVSAVAAAARAAGTLNQGAPDSAVEDAWTVYDVNSQVMTEYVPREIPGQSVALLRCVAAEAESPTAWRPSQASTDWRSVTDPARVDEVSVDHYDLMAPPNDVLVARWLASRSGLKPNGDTPL